MVLILGLFVLVKDIVFPIYLISFTWSISSWTVNLWCQFSYGDTLCQALLNSLI